MIPLIIKSALSLAKGALREFRKVAQEAEAAGKLIPLQDAWTSAAEVALLACGEALKIPASPTITDALARAQKSLQGFKAGASCAGDMEWEPLHPEEFWEPSNDAALSAIEAAQNEIAGAVPLFEDAV